MGKLFIFGCNGQNHQNLTMLSEGCKSPRIHASLN